jgi:hypothetical protein
MKGTNFNPKFSDITMPGKLFEGQILAETVEKGSVSAQFHFGFCNVMIL